MLPTLVIIAIAVALYLGMCWVDARQERARRVGVRARSFRRRWHL